MSNDMQNSQTRINSPELMRWAQRVLLQVGLREADAERLADILITTDARDISTHGITLLPRIVSSIRRGEMNPKPTYRIRSHRAAAMHLDGDNGPGQLGAWHAMEAAMDLAQQAGVGVVTVSNANHFGAASTYTHQATAQQMWGMALSNSRALVAAPNSVEPLLGTNPLSLGANGTGEDTFVIDFSTAAVSRGKIRAAQRDGTSIPEGVATDRTGKVTTDADAAMAGNLLPLGGIRGLGLGLIVELLAGLGGSHLSSEVPGPDTRWGQLGLGQLLVAIDPAAFGEPEEVAARVSKLQHHTRVAAGRAPGDRGNEAARRSAETGIPVSENTCRDLEKLGAMVGVSPPP